MPSTRSSSQPPRQPLRARLAASGALVVALSAVSAVRADDTPSSSGGVASASEADVSVRARAAYDRGLRAHAAGDLATAARAFAEADRLVPSPASLEAALEAAMRSGDVVLVAELLDQGEGRPSDVGLERTKAAARAQSVGATGLVHVDCGGARSCVVSVDGVAADARRPVRALVGARVIVVQRDASRAEHLVYVEAGRPTTIPNAALSSAPPAADPSAPPVARVEEPSPPASSGGVSPAWFFVGLGATAIAGGVATALGVGALGAHDDFSEGGCAPTSSGPRPLDCDARARDGRASQLRTNVMLGVTAALAVSTAALGLFVVRWGPARARVAFAAAPGGGGASLEIVTP